MAETRENRLVRRRMDYTVELDGRAIVVENVPVRVDEESGERYFSPETVEQIQALVWSQRPPDRGEQTSFFRFAD